MNESTDTPGGIREGERGKYGALCDFVHYSAGKGCLGVVLMVIEERVAGETIRANVSVQVDDSVKEQLPKMLREMAQQIEAEQRRDRVLALVKQMRDAKTPEGE